MVCGKDIDSEKNLRPEDEAKRPANMFDKVVVHFYSIICFSTSIILMLLVSMAAVCRYILEIDLYGYEEWAKLFAFWLYFTGAGFGAFNASHVSADLVQAYAKPGFLKNLLVFIKSLFTVIVTFLFTWYGYRFLMFGIKGPIGTGVGVPRTPLWNLPFWASYLAIFLGLLSMSWYFFLEFVRSTQSLFSSSRG